MKYFVDNELLLRGLAFILCDVGQCLHGCLCCRSRDETRVGETEPLRMSHYFSIIPYGYSDSNKMQRTKYFA